MNRGTKELRKAMNEATSDKPAFIVWFEGAVTRLATPAEAAKFRAQHKHLILCRPMGLGNGEWVDVRTNNVKPIPALG